MQGSILAIVLGKKDIGGPDRIYTFYSQELGKISLLGKGTRKPSAKLSSQLETLNLARVFFAKGKGFGNITGALAENNFPKIKENEDFLFAAMEGINLFNSLVNEGERDENLFSLLCDFLDILENKIQSGKIELIKTGFFLKLTQLLGYKAQVSHCAACGGRLISRKTFFSTEEGGTVCAKCTGAGSFKISDDAVKFIRIVYANKFGTFFKLNASEEVIKEIYNLTKFWLKWHFGVKL